MTDGPGRLTEARDDAAPAVALLASWNPTTGGLVESFTAAGSDEVRDAVGAARRAAGDWGATSAAQRNDALLAWADRIAEAEPSLVDAIVDEVGKPIVEAREEVRRAVSIVRYHAAAALDPSGATIPSTGDDGLVFTTSDPLGSVGLITPWNFPAAIPVWKLAPALGYGNTVVWKPSPHATACALRLVELLDHLPAGVVNLVLGDADVGRLVLQAPLDGISFTGSTGAGREAARLAVETGSRFQAELGGKNASVILADADLDRAVSTVVGAAFGFAGQKCTATSRVIVEASVAERVRALLVERVRGLRVGDPRDESTDVGPLIDASAVSRVGAFVGRAIDDGSIVLTGGEPRPELGASFYAPTVLDRVEPGSELARTEIFGPVLAFFEADDASAALERANETDYALSAAVFTSDLGRALEFARSLRAGLVRVNGATSGVPFAAPFGPFGASGIGLPEQGKAARRFFTRERTIGVVHA